MKTALLFLFCVVLSPATIALAQQPATQNAEREHRIALIDMAHIFKSYGKFTAMTAALQQDIEQSDLQAKGMVESLQQIQAQLASNNLEEGSPDSLKLEQQGLQKQTELETFRRKAQREYFRKEADIYKTIYLEVEDLVQKYANYHKYSLVLRFERADGVDSKDPRAAIAGMNRQVVYHRPQDDITDAILKFLNDRWYSQNSGASSQPSGN